MPTLTSVQEIQQSFAKHNYIADDKLATALRLVTALQKPLLVEGPAGVGKTASAKVLADVLGTNLIRLQCYEGLDTSTALYEWNYPKQMLHIRLSENSGESISTREAQIFAEDFLLKRPLLEAISCEDKAPVLLIDEIDRADEEFEAFLLELLGEFQVSIPELGTIKAKHRPYVILTSNRIRELSDALRRRCLYLWQDYPSFEKESAILKTQLPDINERLADQIANIMLNLRQMHFNKVPGVAESLDWAQALVTLHKGMLDMNIIEQTLGTILKDQEDWDLFNANKDKLELVIHEVIPT